jgi:aspartate racemase
VGLQKIGLLGTRYTMEQDFYKGRMVRQHELDMLIPSEPGRTTIHNIIYEELVRGIVKDESREAYQAVMQDLIADGAQGIILGCTEIELLISKPEHCPVPTFPTTYLHALSAVEWALEE